MVKCDYEFVYGKKKGNNCNRVIKVKGETRCYEHKKNIAVSEPIPIPVQEPVKVAKEVIKPVSKEIIKEKKPVPKKELVKPKEEIVELSESSESSESTIEEKKPSKVTAKRLASTTATSSKVTYLKCDKGSESSDSYSYSISDSSDSSSFSISDSE